MKTDNFLNALTIISKSHSNEIIINKVEPNGQVSPVLESPTINIVSCNTATINRLKDAGFSLSMNKGLLNIQDYSL